jgi:MFS family permease
VSDSTRTAPVWTPLRVRAFRALWLAALASNNGMWMQTVGAQWLLVRQPHASILVALVQTADMAPDVMFDFVGGVLADTLDRRRLLIAVQAFMVVVGVALTVLTILGEMPPALLLTFTFVLGSGSVLSLPAYESLIPELVPRSQLDGAATLSALSINLARAVGPAVAGLLIARAGVPAVFALNVATFLFFGIVAVAWRPSGPGRSEHPERFVSALRAGGRYVRYSPVLRRFLLRAALFLVPASALWALLPLVATQRLGQGAAGYGLLLASLGLGAVLASFALPRVRARLSGNALVVTASAVYAAALVTVVLVRHFAVAAIVLLPAGLVWMVLVSNVNAALQLFLPAWVRARGLSALLTVLFGSQALGAILWGGLADRLGLVPTFLVAAGVMLAGAVTVRAWPLIDTAGMDQTVAAVWPQPRLALETEPDRGPVVVRNAYTVAPEHEEEFLRAMPRVRRSRLRTGATWWGLFRDGETAGRFVELFSVPSWEEHLRQHESRLTGTDRMIDNRARALSDPPAQTSHLIAVDVA